MNRIIILLMILCLPLMIFSQDAEEIKKAQAGDPFSQWSIALNYKGEDYEKYVYWLNKLANNTDSNPDTQWFIADAQYDLAEIYKKGECGLQKDEAEYLRWMMKSAGKHNSSACFSLGCYYQDKDRQEAIYWFKKCMDSEWNKNKTEDELASAHLREMGVYYHPGEHVGHSDSGQSYSNSEQSSSRNSSSASYSSQQQQHQHQSRQVWKERWKPCISCDPDRKGRCSNCHGRGGYYIGNIYTVCGSCNGTGACMWCGGRGEIKETYSEWE